MKLSQAKILLVDDEPNILSTTAQILTSEGYQVDAAPNGVQAMRAMLGTHYDLVLTDLRMEGMDGLELLGHIRKHSPQTVTVMMTGYGSIDSAIEAVRLGAYEYLLKPVAVEEIKQAVRRSLDRKRLSELDSLYHLANRLASARDAAAVAEAVKSTARTTLGVACADWITLSRDGRLPLLDERYRSHFTPDLLRFLARGEVAFFEQAEGKPRSCALVPGVTAGRLVSVLYVDHGDEMFDFHASVRRFLLGLTSQGAVAQENLQLLEELRKNNRALEQSNQQLKDLDKLKSQFLSVATHELRTPLSVVLGYNAMIEESALERLTSEEKNLLRESLAACKRLMRLVNSMLDLSQIQSGKLRLHVAPANVAESITAVAALFRMEAQRHGVQVEVNLADDLPPVEMDVERIEQVLVNLVGNALKFTDAGTVTISAARSPDEEAVIVEVRDTGIGIAPEQQAMIFDEFSRVRDGKAIGRPGTGLGLSIARSFVRAHGGDIRVTSSLGQGSAFAMWLPIRQQVSTAMVA